MLERTPAPDSQRAKRGIGVIEPELKVEARAAIGAEISTRRGSKRGSSRGNTRDGSPLSIRRRLHTVGRVCMLERTPAPDSQRELKVEARAAIGAEISTRRGSKRGSSRGRVSALFDTGGDCFALLSSGLLLHCVAKQRSSVGQTE
jgi:hypothetical protein